MKYLIKCNLNVKLTNTNIWQSPRYRPYLIYDKEIISLDLLLHNLNVSSYSNIDSEHFGGFIILPNVSYRSDNKANNNKILRYLNRT